MDIIYIFYLCKYIYIVQNIVKYTFCIYSKCILRLQIFFFLPLEIHFVIFFGIWMFNQSIFKFLKIYFFKPCCLKNIFRIYFHLFFKLWIQKFSIVSNSVFTTLACKTEPAMYSQRQRNFLLTSVRQLAHHATAHNNCSGQQPHKSAMTWTANPERSVTLFIMCHQHQRHYTDGCYHCLLWRQKHKLGNSSFTICQEHVRVIYQAKNERN